MTYRNDIPKFGFGTAFQIGPESEDKTPPKHFKSVLRRAIELGCRHVDCAPLYGTQRLVGEVIKEMEHEKLLARKEMFIVSKLPVNMMRPDKIEKSLRRTLEELQVDYLDLFLIHAPFSTKYVTDDEIYPLDHNGQIMIDDEKHLLESAWLKLADLKSRGLTRYIGLCNVNMEQMFRLNGLFHVDVAQNEYHLFNQDREFFDNCEEIDVHYEAYAGLGCPPKARAENKPTFLNDPLVTKIAYNNNLSNAQVIIQWLHCQPLSYVIRSDNIAQIEENIMASHLRSLSVNEMIELDSLNQNARLYLFDHHKGIAKHREYPFDGPCLRSSSLEPFGAGSTSSQATDST